MRFRFIIFTCAIFPALADAQQAPPAPASPVQPGPSLVADSNQDQVQAATANASANLRDQILRTHLTHDLLVSDFLDRTHSQAELTRVLKGAQPVGGPRWVDERTCQVQLELPASLVGAMLMGLAHTPSLNPPITPQTLKAKFSEWTRLKFSAVGSSAGGEAIETARPKESAGRWTEVTDIARKAAIEQARADANRQMLDAIGPVLLSENTHGSDALARPAIAGSFSRWLDHRPVTRIDFLDDLKVSVTISAPPKSLASAFELAVRSDEVFAQSAKIDWTQVDRQINEFPASIVGSASAVVAGPATTLPSLVLPLQPPDWVGGQLDADATASGGGSRLKVGRAAEADAIDKIRRQFLMLHVDSATTLGDAAHGDPQLKAAVDRALLHVHTYRVDYQKDGSVKVQVNLDLRDAWDVLRANP